MLGRGSRRNGKYCQEGPKLQHVPKHAHSSVYSRTRVAAVFRVTIDRASGALRRTASTAKRASIFDRHLAEGFPILGTRAAALELTFDCPKLRVYERHGFILAH